MKNFTFVSVLFLTLILVVSSAFCITGAAEEPSGGFDTYWEADYSAENWSGGGTVNSDSVSFTSDVHPTSNIEVYNKIFKYNFEYELTLSNKFPGEKNHALAVFNYADKDNYMAVLISGTGAVTFRNRSNGKNTETLSEVTITTRADCKLSIQYFENSGRIKVTESSGNLCLFDLTADEYKNKSGKIGAGAQYANASASGFRVRNIAGESDFECFTPELSGEFGTGKELTAKTAFINNSENTEYYSLAIAVYGIENELVDCFTADNIELPSKSGLVTHTYSFVPDYPEANGDYYAKLFIYEGSLNGIKPLTEAAELTNKHTLFIIGDSIGMDYDLYPDKGNIRRSWIQYLGDNIKNEFLEVDNRAFGGYTTKRFLKEDTSDWAGEKGNWNYIKPLIKPGDYVLISLGTNDYGQKIPAEQYRQNLITFINDTKSLGAEPMLNTVPLSLGYGYDKASGHINPSYTTYSEIVRALGSEYGVAVNDVNSALLDLYNSKIDSGSMTYDDILRAYYDGSPASGPDDIENYDKIHTNEQGAKLYRDVISELILNGDSGIKKYFIKK